MRRPGIAGRVLGVPGVLDPLRQAVTPINDTRCALISDLG